MFAVMFAPPRPGSRLRQGGGARGKRGVGAWAPIWFDRHHVQVGGYPTLTSLYPYSYLFYRKRVAACHPERRRREEPALSVAKGPAFRTHHESRSFATRAFRALRSG